MNIVAPIVAVAVCPLLVQRRLHLAPSLAACMRFSPS